MADSNPASELDSASELPDDVDVAASVGDDIFADGLSEQPFERARLAGAENDQLGPWSFAIATIAFSGSPLARTSRSTRVYSGNTICPFAGPLNGSDGGRARDLRRDRPVRAQPVQPAGTPNYRLEQ